MCGNGLKKKYSNSKIIIYQMTLLDRILGILSCLLFISIPIIALVLGFEHVVAMVILLLVMLIFCIFMYFNVFKTYICLDKKSKKLIIRETPGLKKEEFPLENLLSIEVKDGIDTKKDFTIDIIMPGCTRKFYTWSDPLYSRIAIFGGFKRQTKRLKRFCQECNKYLNNK